jgi:integrase
MSKSPAGIRARHSRTCNSRSGSKCSCKPSWEAWVWSGLDDKKIYRSFPLLSEAKSWRSDASGAVRRGTMRSPSQVTLREAWKTWLAGARDGSVRNRSGDAYKPSVIRSYEASMRLRVLDDFGGSRLSALSRTAVQDLADKLLAKGLDASTIRNTLMPLRVLYRRALARGDVAINPITGIELAAVRGRRERIASPDEAAQLIDALPEDERAVWATACYAGLRLGELQALRDEDVDLEHGVIRVTRSWDKIAGPITPKSRAGTRNVPIVGVLRAHLPLTGCGVPQAAVCSSVTARHRSTTSCCERTLRRRGRPERCKRSATTKHDTPTPAFSSQPA